jgi:hypothetical protein
MRSKCAFFFAREDLTNVNNITECLYSSAGIVSHLAKFLCGESPTTGWLRV